MILDAGVCTVFAKRDTAPPGGMPIITYERKAAGWYGINSFSSRPTYLQQERESTTVALKIRMHQNLDITNRDVIVLDDVQHVPASTTRYEIVRVWHGVDEIGMPISDIDLEVVQP